MKLLHTSDWHIGHTLHDISREEEHTYFLKWLIDVIRKEKISALIIAGDIFDNANPHASSQQMYYDFLIQCRQNFPSLDIVVIGGNHDSALRLDAPASLLKSMKIHVVGGLDPKEDCNKYIIPLYADKNAPWAYVAAVPFLRDFALPKFAEEEDYSTKYEKCAQNIYSQLLEEIQKRKEPYQAAIATGHCFLAYSETSLQSERKIRGNLDAWNVNIFPEWVSYVALGHLHKKQIVGQRKEVRYSGSPIPFSFSEINYEHSVCVVEFTQGRVTNIQEIPVPRPRPLLRIPKEGGTLDFLSFQVELEQLKGHLDYNILDENKKPLLQVSLHVYNYEPDLRFKIEQEVIGLPLKLVDIRIDNKAEKKQTQFEKYQGDSLKEIDPIEIFIDKARKELNEEPEEELLHEFRKLIAHCKDII